MKIEIDLNDILGDEEKVETIQESIHRQVIENLTKVIKDGIKSKIDNAVSKVIDEQIKEAIKEQMPTLVNGLMNCEYVQVDRWGSSTGIKTTFREQLVKAVNENMVYNKDAQYNSDKNMFTKSVDTVIANNLKIFQTEYNKLIDSRFLEEALNHAAEQLRKKLKITTP